MDTKVEAMERRIADQNTSQLEETHLEIVLLSFTARDELGFKADTTDHSTRLVDHPQFFTKEMQLSTGQLFGGKEILKEWDKQFIREEVMQNAMYDANMVHARTVCRWHTHVLSITITSRSTGNVVSVPAENCISAQQFSI
jgi:hypothetical protein